MRRYINRVDVNQRLLTELWRRMGVTVWITSALGTGVDVVLGLKRNDGTQINLMVEIKDGNKPPSGRKLTNDEQKFHEEWNGQIAIVSNEEEAMSLIYTMKGLKDDDIKLLPR